MAWRGRGPDTVGTWAPWEPVRRGNRFGCFAFVLPALVLFRSLRLYGTYLDLVLLVPSTHVGTESLPKHFRAPELAQSNLDAFKPLGVIIKRFDPSEMYREMSLSNKVWSFQFYKLYAWTLLEYERVLMLDADTLAVTNIDDVFDACPRNMVCGTKNPGRIPTSKLQAKSVKFVWVPENGARDTLR